MICLVPQMLKEYITEEKVEVSNNFQPYMMDKIQNRARSFYSQIQDSKEELQMVTTNVSKMQQLEIWIRNEMKMDKKILLFCAQVQSFPIVKNLFQKYQYGVVELDGGNVIDIDSVITKYKKGDANVMLLSGDYATFGMNLEFTSDIVFMNKMDSEKEKQIIGRAQRPGRNDELRIFYLFYFHE
jgi:SNF2 family DNA or RNA helicase